MMRNYDTNNKCSGFETPKVIACIHMTTDGAAIVLIKWNSIFFKNIQMNNLVIICPSLSILMSLLLAIG